MSRLATLASAMVSEKSWSIEAVARLFLGVIMTLCCGIFMTRDFGKAEAGLRGDQLEFLQMMF